MKISNAIIKSICGTALLSLLGGVSIETDSEERSSSSEDVSYQSQNVVDSPIDALTYKIKRLSTFSVIGMDPMKMRHRSHSSHRSHRSGRRGGCSRITEYDN